MLSRCRKCGKPSRKNLCSECKSNEEKNVYSRVLMLEYHIQNKRRNRR